MLSVIAIQWYILVGGFFEKAFHGERSKIQLSLSTFILSDFAAAAVLISFGAILRKVTKPSQLIVIALLEIIFYMPSMKRLASFYTCLISEVA